MRQIRRTLFWCFVLTIPVFTQVPTQNINPCLQQACFFATQSASVSASGTTTLTIQQPATGGRQVIFNAAVVQCPGQTFTVDQSQNGTAASATAGTAVALIPTTATAAAKVWTASNAGSGTAVAPTLSFTSGAIAAIDLSQRTTGLSGTTVNYNVKLTNTGSGSCTGSIAIYWAERI